MRQTFDKIPVSRAAWTLAVAAIAFALAPCESASAAYTFKRLHNFCSRSGCLDGKEPIARLVIDQNDNLYGTTSLGGIKDGVAFKLAPNADKSAYKEYVLHNFCRNNCADGSTPLTGFILDVDGNLYGTTSGINSMADGVIFKLTHVSTTWTLSVLKTFCSANNCTDGGIPLVGLSYAGQAAGQPWNKTSPLFGTTSSGGTYDNGVAYELTPNGSSWNYMVIHNFQTSSNPNELLVDSAGNLYGTTGAGGKNGWGLMYKLASGTWSQTVLHQFCNSQNCSDGGGPLGRLLMDSSGNLFGTTEEGGSSTSCVDGCGALFERTSGGTYSVRYSFCSQTNCADGYHPAAGLVMDGSGNLFGTTYDGGAHGDYGTVFEFSGGTESVLYSFCSLQSCADGEKPDAAVILDSSGEIFGTTALGGAYGGGTVFRLGSAH